MAHPLFSVAQKWRGWLRFSQPLRRRKCGDTSVSPAPPCQTHSCGFDPAGTQKTSFSGGLLWRTRRGSNPQPLASEANTLSN